MNHMTVIEINGNSVRNIWILLEGQSFTTFTESWLFTNEIHVGEYLPKVSAEVFIGI